MAASLTATRSPYVHATQREPMNALPQRLKDTTPSEKIPH